MFLGYEPYGHGLEMGVMLGADIYACGLRVFAWGDTVPSSVTTSAGSGLGPGRMLCIY